MSIFNAIFEGHDFSQPFLYGISNRKLHPDVPLDLYLKALFSSRSHLLQWREKDLSATTQEIAVDQGVQLSGETGKLFLVNTLTELALESGADGVHLTSNQSVHDSLQKRAQAGREHDFLIGKSVHTVSEAVAAEAESVDYLLLGPVFDPISKEAHRLPLGLPGLREAAYMLYTPVFALGGITLQETEAVQATTAVGMAGISWLSEEITQILDSGE